MANNYILPNWSDQQLDIRHFKKECDVKDWQQLDMLRSPSRTVSDLFWLKFPWDEVSDELRDIHVLDIGCGNGEYGTKLFEYSQKNISSYTGIDMNLKEEWDDLKKEHSFMSFIQLASTNIKNHIPKRTNLFISQSAIEHFDEDLTYFNELQCFIEEKEEPVIQVHLFPSSACLPLYLFHGVRQYTPRTVSKITKIFNNNSFSILYGLGGKQCNNIHWNVITKKRFRKNKTDLRHTDAGRYKNILYKAIKEDMKTDRGAPSFYALIIHSNRDKNITL